MEGWKIGRMEDWKNASFQRSSLIPFQSFSFHTLLAVGNRFYRIKVYSLSLLMEVTL
jgi:hypothetical protein